MKCGCGHNDAFVCGEDQKLNGVMDWVLKSKFDSFHTAIVRWRCDCVCHDQYTRRVQRLKLKPEEKRNPSS